MSYLPLHALRKEVADDSVQLVVVFTDDAPKWFDACVKMIEPAISRTQGRITAADVRDLISTGAMQLFLIVETASHRVLAAIVTEFAQHRQGKALNIVMLGGRDAHRWIDRIFELERWAKSEGCRWVELSGRTGWERVLGRLHYEPLHTTLGKELA